jgi:antirestriction protein ArdC
VEVRGEESRGGTAVTMGYNRKQYHWTGEDTKSAEDRALDTFAELMMERIKAIDKDWQKPWIEKGSFMMPRNLSGRPYNGINTFLLLLYSAKQKFDMPVFVTHNQIAYDLNNKSKLKEDKTEKPAVDLNPAEGENPGFVHVLKGEKAFPVFLSIPTVREKDTNKPITLSEYNDMTKEEQERYYVRSYTHVYNVYNLQQTNLKEARPELYAKIEAKFKELDKNGIVPMEEGQMFKFAPLDKMVAENKWICPVRFEENKGAYYSPSKNEIVFPPKKNFIDGESFYGNLLHEMTHSTGSKELFGRLENKTDDRKFDYAREELVAEMSAAVVAHQYGFDKHIKDDSAAYLKSWLGSLKEDPSFLKTTLDDVKRASGFINGKIEEMRLDVREIETITVDVNDDGIADMAISDALADKKQGENERGQEELAAKEIPTRHGRSM